MSNLINRRWVLVDYPDGIPDETHFRLDTDLQVPALEEGQILVQAHFLSVDPYMRGRMLSVIPQGCCLEGSCLQAGSVRS